MDRPHGIARTGPLDPRSTRNDDLLMAEKASSRRKKGGSAYPVGSTGHKILWVLGPAQSRWTRSASHRSTRSAFPRRECTAQTWSLEHCPWGYVESTG